MTAWSTLKFPVLVTYVIWFSIFACAGMLIVETTEPWYFHSKDVTIVLSTGIVTVALVFFNIVVLDCRVPDANCGLTPFSK